MPVEDWWDKYNPEVRRAEISTTQKTFAHSSIAVRQKDILIHVFGLTKSQDRVGTMQRHKYWDLRLLKLRKKNPKTWAARQWTVPKRWGQARVWVLKPETGKVSVFLCLSYPVSPVFPSLTFLSLSSGYPKGFFKKFSYLKYRIVWWRLLTTVLQPLINAFMDT